MIIKIYKYLEFIILFLPKSENILIRMTAFEIKPLKSNINNEISAWSKNHALSVFITIINALIESLRTSLIRSVEVLRRCFIFKALSIIILLKSFTEVKPNYKLRFAVVNRNSSLEIWPRSHIRILIL